MPCNVEEPCGICDTCQEEERLDRAYWAKQEQAARWTQREIRYDLTARCYPGCDCSYCRGF